MTDRRALVTLPRELSDGLLLRKATAADTEALAVFNAGVHAKPYDTVVAFWIRDLLRGDHPAATHDDVLLVEDMATGAIASTACLIAQTWTYRDVPLSVGRPELIATAPAYRRRGLIRTLMETLHAWGEERGHLLQFITGIPNFYRQFGYEPALSIVRYTGPIAEIPPLPPEQEESFRLRPATPDDIQLVARLAEQTGARSLIDCPRDEALWRYELFARDPGSDYVQYARVIETPAGEAVGLVVHWTWIYERRLETILYEVAPGHSWAEVTPSVLRGLQTAGKELAVLQNEAFDALGFTCGPDHPVVLLNPGWLTKARRDFFIYVRIADLAAFLRHIAPVLERRLASSPLADCTGELALSFYRDGLRLRFESDRLVEVVPWHPTTEEVGDAAFPGLTFLQVLLGSRTLEQIEDAFPDCWVGSPRARALLTTLFPPVSSVPWPIG